MATKHQRAAQKKRKKEALEVRKAALAERKSTAVSLDAYLVAKRAQQATMRAEAETAVMRIPQWTRDHRAPEKKARWKKIHKVFDPMYNVFKFVGVGALLMAIGAFLILEVLGHR